MSKHEHKDNKPAKSGLATKNRPKTDKSYFDENHSQDADRHHQVKHQNSEK
jgi:hypothetical protein